MTYYGKPVLQNIRRLKPTHYVDNLLNGEHSARNGDKEKSQFLPLWSSDSYWVIDVN